MGYNSPMAFPEIDIHKIIRSRRRSISLEIDKYGRLIVRMPMRLQESFALKFVAEKSLWIKKKMAMIEKRKPVLKKFVEGEQFMFLGNTYPLFFVQRKNPKLVLKEGVFWMPENRREKAVVIFRDFYKNTAHDFTERIAKEYGEKFNLRYENIKITSAKTRWGSCSSKGNISFSWRLIMSPPGVVEYVVVHEMAHLKHGNHSRKFWSEVERMLPDYKIRKKWLKENGHMLALD